MKHMEEMKIAGLAMAWIIFEDAAGRKSLDITGIRNDADQAAVTEHFLGFLHSHALHIGHYHSLAVAGIYIQSFQHSEQQSHYHNGHRKYVRPEEPVLPEREKSFIVIIDNALFGTKIQFSPHSTRSWQ